ncbi:23S rRNA (guanine(745)-N(1))-methyltransferase [Alishewanella tabrizica]|uniref:23S rRNA (Guanine(745)-N(1))-methyltransferase n=1 Tax=Alishewanella tabrizica TaxID=671278 RepID=A0ABQ2WP14_9ALTE|nr:23S rRNA (guanine(745)-N(1))-methyltransferase [Alishewanella tabrizica]GGW62954.1 23S rRNA (guanine(745)-N(1))-methyltransferase [Alishewanella tabrizica]
MYLCPLCQLPLTLSSRHYQCANKHSFDVAKEGYVNLLPVQQKKSLDPGDNSEMMQARRAFLEAGWYQRVAEEVATMLQPANPQQILDLGCGEGYYSGILQRQLAPKQLYGIDISKAAIRYAAKHYPNATFAVASAYQLPFAADQFDAIVRIYAPSLLSELQRVLNVGGYLLTVTPAPAHLVQIKQAIYPHVKLHSDAIEQLAGFQHCERKQLRFTLDQLTAADLDHLLTMVPLGWKFNAATKTQFIESKPAIECDFYLDLYQLGTKQPCP